MAPAAPIMPQVARTCNRRNPTIAQRVGVRIVGKVAPTAGTRRLPARVPGRLPRAESTGGQAASFTLRRPDAGCPPFGQAVDWLLVTLESLFEHSVDLPSPGHPVDPKLIPAHGGVYAFSDASGGLIQLVGCQNIRRSVELRLSAPQEGKRSRRARLDEVARCLWWVPTGSAFETSLRYLHLSRTLWPDAYQKHLAFGPVWFARAHVDQWIPRWVVEKYALDARAVDIGPFATRRDGTRFIEMLEDAFDLCRHYEILQRAPRGHTCAYFEMGRCAAPCSGGISMEAYRSKIGASARFAAGETASWFDVADSRMRSGADAQQYELAARIKTTIDRADKLLNHPGRITPTPASFRYLIVQRARPPRLVKPFFVTGGKIEEDDAVDPRDVPDLMDAWVSRVTRPARDDPSTAKLHSEQIWLVAHFLRKGADTPGMYLHRTQCESPRSAAESVVRYFLPKQSSSDGP